MVQDKRDKKIKTILSHYKIFQMSYVTKMAAFSFNALCVQPWKKREEISINKAIFLLSNGTIL